MSIKDSVASVGLDVLQLRLVVSVKENSNGVTMEQGNLIGLDV